MNDEKDTKESKPEREWYRWELYRSPELEDLMKILIGKMDELIHEVSKLNQDYK